MSSNAYIGKGDRDGLPVMKVGKTNNLKRRARDLGIELEHSIAVMNDAIAFKIEGELRQLVIKNGGIRFQNTLDWFYFDERIYSALTEYLTKRLPYAHATPDLPQFDNADDEIRYYQGAYYELLSQELHTHAHELTARKTQLIDERDKARDLNTELNTCIANLEREKGLLEGRLSERYTSAAWLRFLAIAVCIIGVGLLVIVAMVLVVLV